MMLFGLKYHSAELLSPRSLQEKIKTIGDAYVACGGIATQGRQHVNDVVNTAITMQVGLNDTRASVLHTEHQSHGTLGAAVIREMSYSVVVLL